jgi:hypothetical protein
VRTGVSAASTNMPLRRAARLAILSAMKKRVVAGLLWFYVTWYAWGVLAYFTGITDLLGPVAGLAVAALIAGDPFGRIWGGKPLRRPAVVNPSSVRELA